MILFTSFPAIFLSTFSPLLFLLFLFQLFDNQSIKITIDNCSQLFSTFRQPFFVNISLLFWESAADYNSAKLFLVSAKTCIYPPCFGICNSSGPEVFIIYRRLSTGFLTRFHHLFDSLFGDFAVPFFDPRIDPRRRASLVGTLHDGLYDGYFAQKIHAVLFGVTARAPFPKI